MIRIFEKTFSGGAHPEEYKDLTRGKPFEEMPLPEQLVVPLSQHLGRPAIPAVKKGDTVARGQLIAESSGFISAPVHSPVCGKVQKISTEANALGYRQNAIIINPEESGEEQKLPNIDSDQMSSETIIQRVKEAGIVGMGGAAFPTYVKLSPPPDKQTDLLILNACECEPYLTRDYRLLIEKTQEVLSGLSLMMRTLSLDKAVIGIEDNKPEAIRKLQLEAESYPGISVKVLPVKYPQGAEKMLIKAVCGKEVPPGKLPLDVGIIVQNVATASAIHNAVINGAPSTEAALTVSGFGINEPKNLTVRIGTRISDLIRFCGGIKGNAVKVVVGGPMMGFAQFDLDAPVTKSTSGILILTEGETNRFESTNCVRCGKCVEVCPLNLTPTKLARFSQLERMEDAEEFGINTCMECGTCAYECPANIPLVHWIRLGKNKLRTKKLEKTA